MVIRKDIADTLPAMRIAGDVNDVLISKNRLVVTAPPGAGKSTLLPLTALDVVQGKIIMLEPRRLAARSIAERMAFLLGEKPGETAGYRIRFENKTGPKTKIEVVTERILTKMIVDDPTLEGIGCVIFDEFHERSLDSDLALALCLESQRLIRDDLRILIMSASIDADEICTRLSAPLVQSEGKMFPVDIEYVLSTPPVENIAQSVADKVRDALSSEEGDVLAFLPGEAEIRKCEQMLGSSTGANIFPLYGMLGSAEQQRAIEPSRQGERKVVLATPIAETSLTIEGVRTVVDSGLYRRSVFDPQTSLSRLETERISMDMALQRAGRAGRTAPGKCFRLWSKGTESQMPLCRKEEILEADLAPVVLDIACWGEGSAENLPWLTPPPATHLISGKELMLRLGMVSESGTITPLGKRAAALPCHPRIAAMLLKADTISEKALACDIAAILEERDPLPDEGADICLRIEALRRNNAPRGPWMRISKIAEQYRSIIKAPKENAAPDPFEAGYLIACAYPGKVAQLRGGGDYLLSNSQMAFLDSGDALYGSDYLAVASVNAGAGTAGRIFLASVVAKEDLMKLARRRDSAKWDSKKGAIANVSEVRIGSLVLESSSPRRLSREEITGIICAAAPKEGLSMFDFSDAAENLQRRIAAVAEWHPEMALPDASTTALLERCAEWLPLYIGEAKSAAELKKIDLCTVIWGLLDYSQQQEVERLAPSHITVPTGSKIRVEYRQGADAPIVRVRLQECFGLLDTPTVDGGRMKVLMELLSPGFKPVQLTSDLRSFWSGTYFEVRKELRLRYPKHSWPEDPLQAPAVRGTGRKK